MGRVPRNEISIPNKILKLIWILTAAAKKPFLTRPTAQRQRRLSTSDGCARHVHQMALWYSVTWSRLYTPVQPVHCQSFFTSDIIFAHWHSDLLYYISHEIVKSLMLSWVIQALSFLDDLFIHETGSRPAMCQYQLCLWRDDFCHLVGAKYDIGLLFVLKLIWASSNMANCRLELQTRYVCRMQDPRNIIHVDYMTAHYFRSYLHSIRSVTTLTSTEGGSGNSTRSSNYGNRVYSWCTNTESQEQLCSKSTHTLRYNLHLSTSCHVAHKASAHFAVPVVRHDSHFINDLHPARVFSAFTVLRQVVFDLYLFLSFPQVSVFLCYTAMIVLPLSRYLSRELPPSSSNM